MLVLSRKKHETLVIDGSIVVKVLQVKGNTIVLGIEAPRDVPVRRGELPLLTPAQQMTPSQHEPLQLVG